MPGALGNSKCTGRWGGCSLSFGFLTSRKGFSELMSSMWSQKSTAQNWWFVIGTTFLLQRKTFFQSASWHQIWAEEIDERSRDVLSRKPIFSLEIHLTGVVWLLPKAGNPWELQRSPGLRLESPQKQQAEHQVFSLARLALHQLLKKMHVQPCPTFLFIDVFFFFFQCPQLC